MPFTDYAPRFPLPDFLVRGMDNAIECALYRDGAIVAPSSGTVSVYDASGTAVVDGAAVTVASSKATYTVAASVVPVTLDLSDRWQIRWALTMSDGQVYTFVREAHLCRIRLYPVVSDDDLTAMHGELTTWKDRTSSSLQGYIDEAWIQLQNQLLQAGRRPWLVLGNSALRLPHLYLSLAIVFRDLHSSAGAGKFEEMAEQYFRAWEQSFGTLTLRYDFDEDGLASDSERTTAPGVVFIGGPGGGSWGTVWPV